MSLGRVNKRTRDQVEWDNCFNPDRDLKPYIDNKIDVEVPQIIADKFPEELEKNETIIHEYIVPNIATYYVRRVLRHPGVASDDYIDFEDILPEGINANQIWRIDVHAFYDWQPKSLSLYKSIQAGGYTASAYCGTSAQSNIGYTDFKISFVTSGRTGEDWDETYGVVAQYKFRSWSAVSETGGYQSDIYFDFLIYVNPNL